MQPHLIRQAEILAESHLNKPITIIGAGAIGSFTCLTLAKMGFEYIKVIDFDKIEIENMNSQFYRHSDIGKYKVHALQDLVQDFTCTIISTEVDKYSDATYPGIVISAVDSMAARKQIWDAHVMKSFQTELFIDPRMGAEVGLAYAMNPCSEIDRATYEKTLYTDQEAVFERCTAKATMYTACMLSGHIAKIVKDFVTKAPYSRITQWSIKDNVFQAYSSELEVKDKKL